MSNPMEQPTSPPSQEALRNRVREELNCEVFDFLDSESRKFVEEIYELSHQSEAAFIESHADIKKALRRAEKKYKYSRVTKGVSKIPIIDIFFEMYERSIPNKYDFKDISERDQFASMWDLVRLHVLELNDAFLRRRKADHRLAQLAQQLFQEIKEKELYFRNLPDAYKRSEYEMEKSEAYYKDHPEGIITLLNGFLSMHHENYASKPFLIRGVRDLWRFAAVRIRHFDADMYKDISVAADYFLTRLSGMKFTPLEETL